MSLQLILGSAGSGKSHYIYEKIIEESIQRPDENFLILVPDQFTMQIQIEMAKRHPRGGLLNIDVSSFTRLAYRLFMETGCQLPPVLEDAGKTMVLKRVAQKKKNSLQVLKSQILRPGYIREVKSMLSECMQYDIQPEDLTEVGNRLEGNSLLQGKLQDLEILYRGFQEFLAEHYVTTEEVLDHLCRIIPEAESMHRTTIVLDEFTGFTPIQNRLLGTLFTHCPKVYITLTLDATEDPLGKNRLHRLSWMTKKTIVGVCRTARETKTEIEDVIRIQPSDHDRYDDRTDLRFLEQHLFRFDRKVYTQTPSHIHAFACDHPAAEMEEISRRIIRLVREEGYRYRDIAVITGDMESYGWEAVRAFEKAGIPCFLDQRRHVLGNPLVECIRAVLAVESTSFSSESVFRYLRTGLVDLTADEVDQLENYCLALGVRGKNVWGERFTVHSRQMDPGEVPQIEALRARVMEHLQPFTEKMHSKNRTVKTCCVALYDLLVALNAQQKLETQKQKFEEENEAALAKEYAQIYRAVMDLMDKMTEILGDEPISIRDFTQLMEEGLMEVKIGIIPPTADQVLVGDVERTRLKSLKALFFAGVNDQVIPGTASSGGLLSETDRDILQKQDMELSPSPREAMFIQKFYLYLHLTKPSAYVSISYAASTAKGESTGPAYLFGTLKRLFPALQVERVHTPETVEHIETEADARRLLLDTMKQMEKAPLSPTQKELFCWFLEKPGERDNIQTLLDAAGGGEHTDAIRAATARVLYGKELMNSVSRIERYAACAYAHFLQYGLRLSEREEYTFRPLDLGNILHACIELFGRMVAREGYTIRTVPDEKKNELIGQCLEQIMKTYGNQILLSSARNRYMGERVEKLLRRSIWAIQEELKDSDFDPAGFEVSFDSRSLLDSMSLSLDRGGRMYLKGKIDRLDLYEDHDRILVRIVDYKTGSKSFDLEEFYYGLQLQLILYMQAAIELEQKQHPQKTAEPAATLYYQIKDPLITAKDGEDVEAARLKELKMNGIVSGDESIYRHLDNRLEPGSRSRMLPIEIKKDGTLSARSAAVDAEQFAALTSYAVRKAREVGQKILDGHTGRHPSRRGDATACDFCAYREVCGFDTRLSGCTYRQLKKQSKDWLWQEILDGRIYEEKEDNDREMDG